MVRLYQWLRERAIGLGFQARERTMSQSVRTEVTVQHRTLRMGMTFQQEDGTCPLCGQRLPPSEGPEKGPGPEGRSSGGAGLRRIK
jgi:hypothetical protein